MIMSIHNMNITLSRSLSLVATLSVLAFAVPAQAVETACLASGGTGCTALIPDGPLPGITSTLNVAAGACGAATPTGVTLRVNITHNYIGDLSISLKNPANQTVQVLNGLAGAPSTACAGDDIAAVFQDGAAAATCASATVPSLSGTVAPLNPLAPLAASTTGTWTLSVTDLTHANNGALLDWGVDLTCVAVPPADVAVSFSGFPGSPVPNSIATGTVTCTNVGGQAATNVNCTVAGGTTSACMLQPANTPVILPVASLSSGQSISCSVSTQVTAAGQINVVGTATSSNDGNPANNITTYAAGNAAILVPTLSGMMLLLLGVLVAFGAAVTARRRSE